MSRNNDDIEDTTAYKVVVNHEEQYSIWPADRENPLGWMDAGKTGPKPECLVYIKEVWTDMRPLSLRKRMEEVAKNPPPPAPHDARRPPRKSLVDMLTEGDHPVEASLRPEKTAQLFKEALDRNHVRIKFIGTVGGTELEVELDRGACDFSRADFGSGTGTVHLEGGLVLDYSKVICVADIDIEMLAGRGRLVKVESKAGA
jgi:uncharacterized protein YbdZ (MbtH family)